MPPQNERRQVWQESIAQENANVSDQFTRVELCQTIGELIKLGYIEPFFKEEHEAARQLVRYRLTEKRP
jgi:hypothetical protein